MAPNMIIFSARNGRFSTHNKGRLFQMVTGVCINMAT